MLWLALISGRFTRAIREGATLWIQSFSRTSTTQTKTGQTPDDFKRLAEGKGLLQPSTKAGQIIAWLKADFGLGYGHAMAIYAVLKPSIPAHA